MLLRSQLLAAVAVAVASLSCGSGGREGPIPADKLAFVGTWRAHSGFTVDVHADGFANVVQSQRPELPDSEDLSIRVAPPVISHIRVAFRGEGTFVLISPRNYAREYHITRSPYLQGGTWLMALDGVTLTRQ